MDRDNPSHVCDFGSSGECRCGLHREGATATGSDKAQPDTESTKTAGERKK
jgi:hypothetical protein